jgi:hypothetical protein
MRYEVLHWIWVAFFIVFGIYLMVRPGCLTKIRGMFERPLSGTGEEFQHRVQAAVLRREEAESVPRVIAVYIGGITVALGIVAALTWIQSGLLYGVMCLLFAMISGITYLQLRNMQAKRVAVLAPRTPVSVIPAFWFFAAVASALSILAFALRPDARVSTIIVCVSSLLTTAIAWRLTRLPALLSGQDIAMEKLVDDRVRATRSRNVLNLAIIQPFVLCSQLLITDTTNVQLAAFFFSLLVFLAYFAWSQRKLAAPLPVLSIQ